MPQFIQAQGVDPILAQMQQQAVTGRQQGLEQARLNAGQYMKDFRQDAADAGYSLGEWAQRNEANVKNALFALSGNNQNVTDQRFQELANAPESFEQKKQRLKDELVKTSPDQLLGTPTTFTTETTTTPGTPGTEAVGMDIGEFRTKAEGMTNILQASSLFFTPETDLSFNKETGEWNTPEGQQWFDWRSNTAKSYGMEDYEGTEKQNKWLMAQLPLDPTGSVDIPSTFKSAITPELQGNYDMILQKLKDRPVDAFAGSAGIKSMLANPEARASAQKLALDSIEKGRFGDFSSYTVAEFKQLFESGAEGGTYKFAGSLPPISFEGTAPTEAKTVTNKIIDQPGTEGLVAWMDRISNQIVKEGGTFGAVEENTIKLGLQKLEGEAQKAALGPTKVIAETNLLNAQVLSLMNNLNAVKTPDNIALQKELFKMTKELSDDYTPDVLIKMNDREKEIYQARLNAIVSFGNIAKLGVALETVDVSSWYEKPEEISVPGAFVSTEGYTGDGDAAAQAGIDAFTR